MILSSIPGAASRRFAIYAYSTVLTIALLCLLSTSACLPALGDDCIGHAKTQSLGSPVSVTGRVVVGVFPGSFYIQDPESGHTACGVLVRSSVVPKLGDAVTVEGALAQDDNDELCIDASSVTITGSATVPKALGRNNRDIGGGTQGVATGPGVAGVNTIGVLQTTWGKADSVMSGKSMIVNDGSGCPIKVLGPIHYIANGNYVRVTGIAGLEKTGDVHSRVIRTRAASDSFALDVATPPQTDPLIDLNASSLTAGTLSCWANSGTLGGVFGAEGTSPVVGTVAGRQCVTFDNIDRMKANFTAPAGITGNGDYTVVVWAYKTSLLPEMPLLSWAATGGAPGTGARFNFGNSVTSGAATHGTDAFDFPFGSLKPSTGVWHQVAVTYDGSVEKAYIDGAYNAQKTNALNITSGQPLYLGCGYGFDGSAYVPQTFLPASIASVRVYDYALSSSQIKTLFSDNQVTRYVTGLVTDRSTAQGIVGAKVYFAPLSPASADPAYVAGSGTGGPFIATVPPGNWQITVVAPGYTTVSGQVTVADKSVSGLNFSLAQIGTGEALSLDASYLTPGPLSTWPVTGLQQGNYISEGSTNPVVGTVDGIQCVTFDGTARMRSDFGFPYGISGIGDWTICAWVYNPSFDPEECVFSWAPRGGTTAAAAQLNFGNSLTSGAVTHWGGADMAFAGGQPTAGAWHHIAVTYYSGNEKLYVDGVLNATRSGSLAISSGMLSFLGSGFRFDGVNYTYEVPFSGSIHRIGLYDVALDPATIQNLANSNPRYVKVMPLGDSITDGYNVPGGYRIKLWNSIIGAGKHVDFVGSGFNGPTSLGDKNHEGHPGWTCTQLNDNIDAWMNTYQPKIVLIHICTNDIYFGADAATCITRLSTLIDKIAPKLPVGGKIYVSQIIPWGGTYAYLDPTVKSYNSQVSVLAAQKVSQGKPVYVVNMYGDTTTNPNGVFPTDLADGVHPNTAGYDKMADIWWNAIKDDITY